MGKHHVYFWMYSWLFSTFCTRITRPYRSCVVGMWKGNLWSLASGSKISLASSVICRVATILSLQWTLQRNHLSFGHLNYISNKWPLVLFCYSISSVNYLSEKGERESWKLMENKEQCFNKIHSLHRHTALAIFSKLLHPSPQPSINNH